MRAERYAICGDLREQLVEYVNKKLRESSQRADALVPKVIASVQSKRFGWGLSPAEATWVCGQLVKHFEGDKPSAVIVRRTTIDLMRIQLASDLHLEHLRRNFPGERVISHAHGVDLLVLAGDIANGLDAVDFFDHWPVPVLYVAGNHELYGHEMPKLRRALREACVGTSICLP